MKTAIVLLLFAITGLSVMAQVPSTQINESIRGTGKASEINGVWQNRAVKSFTYTISNMGKDNYRINLNTSLEGETGSKQIDIVDVPVAKVEQIKKLGWAAALEFENKRVNKDGSKEFTWMVLVVNDDHSVEISGLVRHVSAESTAVDFNTAGKDSSVIANNIIAEIDGDFNKLLKVFVRAIDAGNNVRTDSDMTLDFK